MQQMTVQMVRALRGAPLTVLVLMAIERRPVALGYVERHTGYSDKIVHEAVRLLSDYGLAVQTGRYIWQIVGELRQLPLMYPDLPAEETIDPETSENPAPEEPENLGRNFSDLSSEKFRPNPSSSSSLTTDLEVKDDIELPLPVLEGGRSEKIRANQTACDEAGICEPKRSQLAAMEAVTPRAIRYHTSKAKTLGLAIYRIEHGWQVPDAWVDPHEQADEPEIYPPLPDGALELYHGAVNTLVGEMDAEQLAAGHGWIRNAELVMAAAGGLTVRASSEPACAWLEQHVKRRLGELTGMRIDFTIF
jgi:hypothetical protein